MISKVTSMFDEFLRCFVGFLTAHVVLPVRRRGPTSTSTRERERHDVLVHGTKGFATQRWNKRSQTRKEERVRRQRSRKGISAEALRWARESSDRVRIRFAKHRVEQSLFANPTD